MVFQAIRASSHKVIGTDNGMIVAGKLFRAILHVVEDIPNTGARLAAMNIKFGRERVSYILPLTSSFHFISSVHLNIKIRPLE